MLDEVIVIETHSMVTSMNKTDVSRNDVGIDLCVTSSLTMMLVVSPEIIEGRQRYQPFNCTVDNQII